MTELQEQYRLLEVSTDVSFATLKQAYKDLVLVWHPDRFSDHPRLQKKAEEKLKCINLAYQELSAVYREERHEQEQPSQAKNHQSPRAQRQADRTDPQQPHSNEPFNQKQHQSKTQYSYSKTRYHAKNNDQTHRRKRAHTTYGHVSGISVTQARFVIGHFHFQSVQRPSDKRLRFKSGPFNLEMNLMENWLSLANLCDSINGFHPILLAIPCKSSRLFVGSEAQELIALFKQTQRL